MRSKLIVHRFQLLSWYYVNYIYKRKTHYLQLHSLFLEGLGRRKWTERVLLLAFKASGSLPFCLIFLVSTLILRFMTSICHSMFLLNSKILLSVSPFFVLYDTSSEFSFGRSMGVLFASLFIVESAIGTSLGEVSIWVFGERLSSP